MLFQEEVNKLREGEWNDDNRALITAMPTFQSLRTTLYRARNKNLPKLPKTRREIEIPEQFSKTTGGEDFLLINDGADDKILGFATSANLELLCDADTVYGDGTFYVVPRIFYQLYTLHAMVDGSMFPLVFFMLPDKKEVTYQRMFRLLRDAAAARGLQFLPSTFQMDYEDASRVAARTVFNCEWKGCFFHYAQCIWRRTQQAGLQVDYANNPEVKMFIRRIAALPLVPSHQVEDHWLEILDAMPDSAGCRAVADYLTTNWIEGGLHLNQWNHHDTNGPRTNNNLEGWHSRLKKVVAKAHPNIFEFISFLKKEQSTTESLLVQYQGGMKKPPTKKRYRTIEARFQLLKVRLANGTISLMEYADACAALLKNF